MPGEPAGSGPAAAAPDVRRGKDLRSAVILRVFAIERYFRALVFAVAAFAVWRFEYARVSIDATFDREYPIVRTLLGQLGYNVDRSKLVGLFQRALTMSSATISLIAVLLAAYAVVEAIEGTGLWLAKRWGEYFAMVVTSFGLPYEIYEMTSKITATRVIFFVINLALVLYLVITKRLLRVRGGKRAYEARLKGESILQAAVAAVAAERAAGGTVPDGQGQDELAAGGPVLDGRGPDEHAASWSVPGGQGRDEPTSPARSVPGGQGQDEPASPARSVPGGPGPDQAAGPGASR